jgi:hypothetical protein
MYENLKPFGCIIYPNFPPERMPKGSIYRSRAYKGALLSNISAGNWTYWDFQRGKEDIITSSAEF